MENIGVSSKAQAPAFAEAPSRRQAKLQINSNVQKYLKFPLTLPLSPKGEGRGEGEFGHLNLFGICNLWFGI